MSKQTKQQVMALPRVALLREQRNKPPQPWNKKNNKCRKRNGSRPSKTADWAGLLRNFATIIASFISVITLFYPRPAKRTYLARPGLVARAKLFFRLFCRDTRSRMRRFADHSEYGFHFRATRAALHMNLGLGAAGDLRIAWSFGFQTNSTILCGSTTTFATGVTYESKVSGLLFEKVRDH
ncbi:MAG: hypothetical protein IPM98_19400 [Lewinellaceae bacterium]|nr:hypothetical protein [Lewinellaceae bacterium]